MILVTLAPKWIQRAVRSQVALRLCVNMLEAALLVCAVFVGGIMLFMGHTLTDASWLAWQTALTIGYGTNLPENPPGKWFVMLAGTFAVFSATAIFGAVITYMGERQARWKGGLMNNPHKDGYIFFGYPGETNLREMIKQIRVTQPDVSVCVVDNKISELPVSVREMPHIHFVLGDLLRETTFQRAGIHEARGVAILPIDRNDPNSDAATASAVRLIAKFIAKKGGSAKLIHMLVDPDNEALFEGLSSQMVTKAAPELLVAQELQGAGTARVIQDLLRNDDNEDPQTYTPTLTAGMSWGELVTKALDLYRSGAITFTPLSLVREDRTYFHPPWDETLRESDLICVVGANDFSWEAAEEALTGKQRVREPELSFYPR